MECHTDFINRLHLRSNSFTASAPCKIPGFSLLVSVSRHFVLSHAACQPITGCSVKALLTVSHLADRLHASFAFKAPYPHRDISGCQVTVHGLSAAHVCPSSVYTHIQYRCVKSKHHDSVLDSWSLFLSYPGIVRNDVFYRGLGLVLDLFIFWWDADQTM